VEFYRRTCRAAERITHDFEIILVNDGSPDSSLDVALALFERDPRVKIVDLSRNFSHHKAMMTGFMHAQGDLVFQIDCDLEEEPELLGRFYKKLVDSGADVVFGVRQKRKGGFLERVGGQVFWWLFNRLASCTIPANRICATLMSRRYVDNLITHQEREVFLAGLQALNGFKQVPVVVETRWRGRSTYTLTKRVTLLVNAITAFSSKPLVYIFYLGSTISLVATAAAFYLIVRRLFFGAFLEGWPSLIVSIWLLGGLIIFCLGVIGIYLAKMFVEIKQRPYTIVRRVYDRDERDGDDSWPPRQTLSVGRDSENGVIFE
jgi:putative glycosyltransferase